MPLTKSALKKQRKDIHLTAHNKKIKENIRKLIKDMCKNPSQKQFSAVSSALDKAAKTHYFHPNKSARLKSRLSHLLSASK